MITSFFLTSWLYRNHGSHFEKAKAAFEEGAANEEPIVDEPVEQEERSSDNESGNEKGGVVLNEKV